MGRKRRSQSRGDGGDRHKSRLAQVSLVLLLANGFVWAGLRDTLPALLLALLSLLLALAGWVTGIIAQRRIRRRHGAIEGESVALIGYWGNLIVVILTFLLFSYLVAMGILRGELI